MTGENVSILARFFFSEKEFAAPTSLKLRRAKQRKTYLLAEAKSKDGLIHCNFNEKTKSNSVISK